ncbi:MAG: hypothetical protein ISS55_01870 [Dehalococcoidales bacterium]|nr:hypothetical protein [Dehalococcoidales bacterium]
MSKFIDRLTRSTQATSPMGFRTAQSAAVKPKLQLVAVLTAGSATGVSAADAGLLRISRVDAGGGVIKKLAGATPDIPWGVWLEADACGQMDRVAELGCDFVVFPAVGTALTAPPDDGIGMVLQIESSVPEGQLRTANDLPVDAVLVTAEQAESGPVTWDQLMLWRRFAGLLAKPLLVSIPHNTGADELQMLWDAGITGVIFVAGPDNTTGELIRLRQVIDGLRPPSPRKKSRPEAIVPQISPGREPAVETEEDDDDDDE